jgi:hypothetical protein
MVHFVLKRVDRSMTAARWLDERPEHGNPAAAEPGRVRGHRVGASVSFNLRLSSSMEE